MEKILGVNWKTTLAGLPPLLIGATQLCVGMSALFHLTIPGITVTGDPMTMVQQGGAAVCMGLVGVLAKDRDVTGGTRHQ